MSRCCANCFWCFTQDDEIELEGYSEDDPNRPQAGDCCIGQEHDENYCCSEHSYIDGMEEYENYVLYDDEYLGPGYLIVSKLDDEIVKFIKICSYGEGGFSKFYIRAYKKDSIDNPNQDFRAITITANQGEPLYDIIYNLAKSLSGGKIESIDSYAQGKNNLRVEGYMDTASLIISKDVYGAKHFTDFVDIHAGDNASCEFYDELVAFYNNLSTITVDGSNEKDIKQLLLKKYKQLCGK